MMESDIKRRKFRDEGRVSKISLKDVEINPPSLLLLLLAMPFPSFLVAITTWGPANDIGLIFICREIWD